MKEAFRSVYNGLIDRPKIAVVEQLSHSLARKFQDNASRVIDP